MKRLFTALLATLMIVAFGCATNGGAPILSKEAKLRLAMGAIEILIRDVGSTFDIDEIDEYLPMYSALEDALAGVMVAIDLRNEDLTQLEKMELAYDVMDDFISKTEQFLDEGELDEARTYYEFTRRITTSILAYVELYRVVVAGAGEQIDDLTERVEALDEVLAE